MPDAVLAAAESPWATTSARFEAVGPPSTFVPERVEGAPQAPPAAAKVPPEASSRGLILVLSVILAVALLALAAITIWQGLRGREPISVGYTEPPSTAEDAPASPASASAAPSPTAAPRPPARQRTKNDDVYEQADKEQGKR
jgi:hypothetical protein